MRTIPEPLAADLAGGVTTHARCWQLRRRDGVVLGFTDHDRDIAFDGVVHRAGSGLDASAVASELGLAVGGGEIAGALTSAAIDEAGLEAGLYDGAVVSTLLVDWSDPGKRLVLAVGTIGEVKRRDGSFVAELRSAAHRLDQVQGRLFGKTCDADLGDARCGVSLPALSAAGTVSTTDGRLGLTAAGLAGHAAGRFTAGRLAWTSGANSGAAVEVKAHSVAAGAAVIELWRPTAEAIAVGDAFSLSPGCDKSWRTCRETFSNGANFRGFPHIPGNDRVLAYPSPGGSNRGRSLVRDG